GEFDRVADEVQQHLIETLAVALNSFISAWGEQCHQIKILFPNLAGDQVEHRFHAGAGGKRLGFKFQLVRFQLGEIKNVIEQGKARLAALMNNLHHLPLLVRQPAFQHHFRGGQDSIYRITDFMAYAGDEIRPVSRLVLGNHCPENMLARPGMLTPHCVSHLLLNRARWKDIFAKQSLVINLHVSRPFPGGGHSQNGCDPGAQLHGVIRFDDVIRGSQPKKADFLFHAIVTGQNDDRQQCPAQVTPDSPQYLAPICVREPKVQNHGLKLYPTEALQPLSASHRLCQCNLIRFKKGLQDASQSLLIINQQHLILIHFHAVNTLRQTKTVPKEPRKHQPA
ncbi:MAG: hypothetical protein WCO56_29435, partial [Verrucomicrobiota bacterium]